MKMQNQRLRNLTTGRLHTEIGHLYEDLGLITGETELPTPSKEERQAMFDRYLAQPNPLAGKQVIGITI